MFVAEVTTNRSFGTVTDVYTSEEEFELTEWVSGVVVQAVGAYFIYVRYSELVSVVLKEEEVSVEDDASAVR